MDRISNLPDIAIGNILTCLSLRDAVRTSVLSHSWREKWCTVPQLIFDRKGFPHSRNETLTNYERRLRRTVDQVLLLHRGPIHKFKLTIARTSRHDIDRWIHVLSRCGVKEFILNILQVGKHYSLPFYFFSFKEFTYLELHWCMFYPPSNFSGYIKLTVLNLSGVVFTNDGLGVLLSLCPLLKKLLLTDISGCTSLRINSHKLVELSTDGIPVSLECAPLLARASIKYPIYLWNLNAEDEMVHHNIVNVFGYLPSIERLAIRAATLESFAVGHIPVKLPVLLPLSHLSIHINFDYMKEVLLAAFCILRSSVMLEKLDIKALYFGHGGGISDDFWQAQDFSSAFYYLRIVKITKFAGTRNQLKFIELIIANAPVLERLQIKFLANIDESKILLSWYAFQGFRQKLNLLGQQPELSFCV